MNDNQFRERNLEQTKKKSGGGSWAVAGLAVLGTVAWFGVPVLLEHEAMNQPPEFLSAAAAPENRFQSLDGTPKIGISAQEIARATLADTVSKGETPAVKGSSTQLADLSGSAYKKLKSEFDDRLRSTEARLAQLEAAEHKDQASLAQLRTDLGDLRDQMTRQIAAVRDDGARETGLVRDRLVRLNAQFHDQKAEFEQYKRDRATKHMAFELSKNRAHEVAPGIIVHVSGTNVRRRQVKGWMWIMPDRKTVWLKDQNAMQPVIFYSHADGKRREVVFTHVTRDSAVGYALVPETLTQAQVAAAGGSEALTVALSGN